MLVEVAKAVGGGYCRLQMPLKPALGVRGTVAGHRLSALEGGSGGTFAPSNACLRAGRWEGGTRRGRTILGLRGPLGGGGGRGKLARQSAAVWGTATSLLPPRW